MCRSFYIKKKKYLKGAAFLRQKDNNNEEQKSIEMLDWRYCLRRWPETKKCFAPANKKWAQLSVSFFCTAKVNNLIKVYSPSSFLLFFDDDLDDQETPTQNKQRRTDQIYYRECFSHYKFSAVSTVIHSLPPIPMT